MAFSYRKWDYWGYDYLSRISLIQSGILKIKNESTYLGAIWMLLEHKYVNRTDSG